MLYIHMEPIEVSLSFGGEGNEIDIFRNVFGISDAILYDYDPHWNQDPICMTSYSAFLLVEKLLFLEMYSFITVVIVTRVMVCNIMIYQVVEGLCYIYEDIHL